MAYRRKNGPLNLAQRMDWGFAMQASLFANVHRDSKRQPFKVTDFLQFHEPEPEKPISLEDAMKQWGGAVKR